LAVVLEPLFRSQLTHSLLDLPQAVFILIYLFAFSKIKHPLWLMVSGLSLGAAAAIKFPAAALILSFISFLTIFYQKRSAWGKYLKRLLLINFFAFMVFTLAYLPLLLSSGINAWFDLLIKASRMHLSHVPQYPKGVVFLVLLFNQWPRWWGKGGYQTVLEWQYSWPLLGVVFLISPILAIKNRLLTKEPLLFFFVWSYLIFLASRLFFPAYLLPILPFGFLFLWLTPSLFLRK